MRKGLTLIEILVTIGILSLIILTLISSSIFIVKSNEAVSKSNIIKSKLKHYYYDIVFIPYITSNLNYSPNTLFDYTDPNKRKILEINEKNRGRIYGEDSIISDLSINSEQTSFTAIEIFQQLKQKLKQDVDIKNWGIEIEEVTLKLSDKPVQYVIVPIKNADGNIIGHKLIATLIWFDVSIKYKTKDGRIVEIKEELPLINNVDSNKILPPGYTSTSTSGPNTGGGPAAGGGGGGCFEKDAELIVLIEGKTLVKKIKDIKEGDLVLGANEIGANEIGLTFVPVEKLNKREGEFEIIQIKTENNKVFRATPNHPAIINGRLKKFEKLQIGDKINILNNNNLTEEKIIEIKKEKIKGKVYSIELKMNKNQCFSHFIGTNKNFMLVHCGFIPTKELIFFGTFTGGLLITLQTVLATYHSPPIATK